MRILSFNNADELARQTEVLMREFHHELQRPLRGFFPTGRSAEDFYALLRNDPIWRQNFFGIQIDEFNQPEQLFLSQLQSQVILPLDLQEQFETLDPIWSDQEMKLHIRNVLSREIDFALLGLGPNGHIGFHEPGLGDQTFLGGQVELSEQSYKRVKGATTRNAITFGAGAFLKAKKIFMIATGEEKIAIFSQFLKTAPSIDLPASLLKDHADFTVLTTFNGAS